MQALLVEGSVVVQDLAVVCLTSRIPHSLFDVISSHPYVVGGPSYLFSRVAWVKEITWEGGGFSTLSGVSWVSGITRGGVCSVRWEFSAVVGAWVRGIIGSSGGGR